MSQILVDSEDLKTLIAEMRELKSIVLSDKTTVQWLEEKQAALLMGFKNAESFRRKVKAGALPIEYCNTNGTAYQYSRKSINNYLNEYSTISKLSK